jgi:selenocysteine lyase/cysteine desulfurase
MDDRLAQIRRDVVGADASFDGPFGRKTMLYADWTASGRALVSVEDYVRDEVLPLYANTHTTTSTCGLQSTCFRQEARQLIAQACNARVGYSDKHADVVVFAGSGSTAAINKLSMVLGMHLPPAPGAPREAQPVVLVGPHEHHSNILPWRESCALVVQIGEDKTTGSIDQNALVNALEKYKNHKLVAGSFSAASNVTGVMADVDTITETLHRHGALAFWDYAAAAPYVQIDMNPVRFTKDGSVNKHVYKDAVFVSPHKLPGRPRRAGRARRETSAVHQRGALRAGRRHGVLRDGERPAVRKQQARKRGGRDAGYRRRNKSGARVSNQSARRSIDRRRRRGKAARNRVRLFDEKREHRRARFGFRVRR